MSEQERVAGVHNANGSVVMVGIIECALQCAENEDFVENWQRLRGMKLGENHIARAIDKATGYDDVVARTFIDDVINIVWSRLSEKDRGSLAIDGVHRVCDKKEAKDV